MIIDYTNKNIRNLNVEDKIKAKIIEYTILEEDLYKLSENQTEEYSITRIFLRKDNIYDLVVDNIDNGRILIGGLVDNKAILSQYIVEKGINEILAMLAIHN